MYGFTMLDGVPNAAEDGEGACVSDHLTQIDFLNDEVLCRVSLTQRSRPFITRAYLHLEAQITNPCPLPLGVWR